MDHQQRGVPIEAAQNFLLEALPIYQSTLGTEHLDTKAVLQQIDKVQAILNDAANNHLLK